LLTVLLELSFHNEHKLCCTLLIDIFSLSGLNNLLKQSMANTWQIGFLAGVKPGVKIKGLKYNQ
jgi:hypothetical protein